MPQLVHRALHELPLAGLDLLFIENVGNLVCPASFDLGQHLNVTLLSVTEGDDKPAKYPVIFRASDLVVLSKTDLLGRDGRFRSGARRGGARRTRRRYAHDTHGSATRADARGLARMARAPARRPAGRLKPAAADRGGHSRSVSDVPRHTGAGRGAPG